MRLSPTQSAMAPLRLCAQADLMSGWQICLRSFSAARIVGVDRSAPENAGTTLRTGEQRRAERMHSAILSGSALYHHTFIHRFFSALHSGSALDPNPAFI